MKDEYKQYRKSIRKKHAFGFWNEPAYQEDMTVSIKPKVAIYLFGKVLEELEWGIGALDDESLGGVCWTKKHKTLQQISVLYKDPVTIQIRSQSEEKNMTDWGANYRNVKLLLHVYEKLTKGYTRQQYEAIEIEIDRRNNWDNYEIPETLPAPYIYRKPSKQKFLLGLIVLFFPIVLSSILSPILFKKQELSYVFEGLWCLSMLYSMKYLFRWSRYMEDSIFRMTTIVGACTLVLSLLLGYPFFYLRQKLQLAGFQNHLMMLSEVKLDWDIVLGISLLKIFIAVILFSIPVLSLNTARINFFMWKYPEEVADLVYYFKVKRKHTDAFVKTELAKRGWTDPILQKELLEMQE